MSKKLTLLIGCIVAICCTTSAHAVYFPGGVDWDNPSQNRFALSLYLNMLGRQPEPAEMRTASRFLDRTDNSQRRLELFQSLLGTNEYQQIFGVPDNQWKVYRAPDLNYGDGFWRYIAAQTRPDGFKNLHLSGSSSESVARTMAHYYSAFCYQGARCVSQPVSASRRATEQNSLALAHACADESQLVSQFQWTAANGTTFPRGTSATTVCLGQHYYEAVGNVLQRYQCDAGYINCQRNQSRDIRGQRSGLDRNGNPTIFFADGTTLTLTSYDEESDKDQSGVLYSDKQQGTALTADQHSCANPTEATSRYRWEGSNGASDSVGVGSTTVCMDNYYYTVDGLNLRHHSCNDGFRDCRADPSKDISAARRTRVDGFPGLVFRNGTTLTLIKKSDGSASAGSQKPKTNPTLSNGPETPVQSSGRPSGSHECADSTLRVSQFRWKKQNGALSWPDGVDGRFVCLDNAYYQIDGITLRHYQCGANFSSCRANRRNDLIATRDTTDGNGYRTLTFANGDQLSLISR